VYEKFANDVVAFDRLASACSDQVGTVEFESGRRYNRIRFTVPNVGEAVLRRNPNGFSAVAKAVAEDRSYCFGSIPMEERNLSITSLSMA